MIYAFGLALVCLVVVQPGSAHSIPVEKREPKLKIINDDILIPESEHAKLMSDSEKVRRSAITTGRLWEDAVIPYYIVPNTFEDWEVQNIKTAMKTWEKETCLQFKETSPGNSQYLNVQREWSGCNAIVGMSDSYGQSLNLDSGCTNLKTTAHELGHSIGFNHEHQRPDRDDYLIVYSQNSKDGFESSFTKDPEGEVFKEKLYDYMSIMHYSSFTFSRNGYPTMVAKDSAYSYLIGASEVPSFGDYKAVNDYYKCTAKFESRDGCSAPSCPDGSYVGPNCKCMCPDNVLEKRPVKECASGETPSVPTPPAPGDCLDTRQDCAYFGYRGDCLNLPDWMMRNCPVSCNRCSRDQSCQDNDSECFKKAGEGQCESDPGYMHQNCKKACRKCNDGRGCSDQSDQCMYWAEQGFCERDPDYMGQYCQNICKDRECVNENDQCDYWASIGECEKNPYMLGSCRKACKSCDNYTGSKDCVKL